MKSVETELDWLWQAADEEESGRPALQCIHTTDEAAEATDGHRLHRIEPHSFAFKPGLIDRAGKAYDGTYPDTSKVIVRDEARGQVRKIDDVELVRVAARMVKAGQERAYGSVYLEVPTGKGIAYISGKYVADALKVPLGTMPEEWTIFTMGPHDPVQFRRKGLIAVVMPVRVAGDAPKITLNIERFLGPVIVKPVVAELTGAALD